MRVFLSNTAVPLLMLCASVAQAQVTAPEMPVPAEPAPSAPAVEPPPAAPVVVQLAPVYETLTDPDAAAMLAAHNAWRRRVGAPDLAWSDEAASLAQHWADELAAKNCQPSHNPDATRRKVFGENIYNFWATKPYVGFKKEERDVVDSWGIEIKYYDEATNSCSAPASETCGHYTQMVWSRTQKVGCARAKCDAAEVWVCEYFPRGNYTGVHPYKPSGKTEVVAERRRRLPEELVVRQPPVMVPEPEPKPVVASDVAPVVPAVLPPPAAEPPAAPAPAPAPAEPAPAPAPVPAPAPASKPAEPELRGAFPPSEPAAPGISQ